LGVGRVGPCPVIYVSFLSPLRVSEFLEIALAPLVAVTTALVLAGLAVSSFVPWATSILLFAASFNIAGSAGDLVMYSVLRSAPSDAVVVVRGMYLEVKAEDWRPIVPVYLKFSAFLLCFMLASSALAVLAALLLGGELSVRIAGFELVLARVIARSVNGCFELTVAVEPIFVAASTCLALLSLLALDRLVRVRSIKQSIYSWV